MSPQEVKGLSPWEFAAAVDGWVSAHVPEDKGTLDGDDADALWEGVKARMH